MSDQLTPEHNKTQSEQQELHRPIVNFIDEYSAANPYKNFGTTRGIKSKEQVIVTGKEEMIRAIGQQEAAIFQLKGKGDVLEVGWGGNRFFAEGMYEATGSPISILDIDFFEDNPRRSQLPENAARDNSVQLYRGTAEGLATNDELKGKTFGAIAFHGSLFGGGFNWTIEQRLESEYSKSSQTTETNETSKKDIGEFIDENMEAVLKGAKEHLAPGGVFIVTSDRFSLFADGRNAEDIPQEKLEFLNLIAKALTLGAKEITVFGVSANGVRSNFTGILGAEIVGKLANGVEILPNSVKSDYLTEKRIHDIKQLTKGVIPSDIGIIDAVGIAF